MAKRKTNITFWRCISSHFRLGFSANDRIQIFTYFTPTILTTTNHHSAISRLRQSTFQRSHSCHHTFLNPGHVYSFRLFMTDTSCSGISLATILYSTPSSLDKVPVYFLFHLQLVLLVFLCMSMTPTALHIPAYLHSPFFEISPRWFRCWQ